MVSRQSPEERRKHFEQLIAKQKAWRDKWSDKLDSPSRAGGVASGEARRRSQALRDVQIKALHEQGLKPLEIAEQLECSRTTVYESLRRQRTEGSCTTTYPQRPTSTTPMPPDWLKRRLRPEDIEVRRRGGRKGGRATARLWRRALVPQDKAILNLRTKKRLKVSEIAAETGLSERSVYRSLARSRQRGMLI